jgi:citrate synthase
LYLYKNTGNVLFYKLANRKGRENIMNNMIEKIVLLEEEHDKLDPEIVKKKNVKLGLRNTNGTGVVAGITSKGQVKGYETNSDGEVVAVPGKLYYCGYDVEEIANSVDKENRRFGFEETAYLLLTGELPMGDDLKSFSQELASRRQLPDLAKSIITSNSANDDQMGALHSAVASLHKFDKHPKAMDIRHTTEQCVDLIAKIPTVIAYNYAVLYSHEGATPIFIEPREDLSIAENFLYMMNGEVPDPVVAQIFDMALILHAEHGGGNNSTFTVRTVTSSLTDTYMAICAGIASLAGHLHGGANEAVMGMMDHIKADVKDWTDDDAIRAYLEGIMDKTHGDGSGKIFGMGHAVYTVSDPREIIFREKARVLAEEAGRMDEYNLYMKVKEIAEGVVKERKGKMVCANVDFLSGFVYDMIGIPKEIFTPIFAMSRVVGWTAHRIEEIIQGRLIRPAYASTIDEHPTYPSISERLSK